MDVEPADALLEEVQRTAGAVRWLEARIREIDPAQLTWGMTARVTGRQAQGRVDYSEARAGTHPLLAVYQAERAHLVTVCRVTIAAGIAERQVQLAERIGSIMADTLTAVLEDLNLTPEQRQAAQTLVPRRLRLLAGDLNAEGPA